MRGNKTATLHYCSPVTFLSPSHIVSTLSAAPLAFLSSAEHLLHISSQTMHKV